MKRIGILGVDALTEKLIRGFFQAAPDAQVFLFPANSERAQRLAREFPCWTQDNHQAAIDEVDVIIISVAPDTLNELSGSVQLRNSQTLISLVPGIQSRALRVMFQHSDCVRLQMAYSDEINKSAVILTSTNEEIQRLFSPFGPLLVVAEESDFDSSIGGTL
ncbi:NAD(P)-binding domain-containing protein [Raoultella terrigena]|uniref:NAD(P)-binding domain-containing protein n=1 Tax=Raoultella terrigena TaxID=577 RepID=UPI003BF4B0F1